MFLFNTLFLEGLKIYIFMGMHFVKFKASFRFFSQMCRLQQQRCRRGRAVGVYHRFVHASFLKSFSL